MGGLPRWEPAPGNEPQRQAYESEANISGYGGKPYGGKSDLQLGLARNEHTNSLLLRRTFPELKRGFVPRSIEFYGDRKYFNASENVWKIDGKRIEFGYGEKYDDFLRYKGPNWDLVCIDEASEIPKLETPQGNSVTPVDILLPWNRTTIKGQTVRMLLGFNPGGLGEAWIVELFGPWLNTEFPNPAKVGEIRFVTRNEEGVLVWVSEDTQNAKSITFFASSWRDNPHVDDGEYEKNLDLLPEPLRSQLKLGLFGVGTDDDRWQVIPSAWVRAAQSRWVERADVDHYDSVGVDVAAGGKDKTIFSGKIGNWFDKLKKYKGSETPDGPKAAMLLFNFLKGRGTPRVLIDWIGFGSSCYDSAKDLCDATQFVASGATEKTDKSGRLTMANKRAEVWWSFREALDPQSGEDIALPPDQELLADLCCVKYEPAASGKIKMWEKKKLQDKLGRSPDCGDAVVICWHAGGSVSIKDFYPDDKSESVGMMEEAF